MQILSDREPKKAPKTEACPAAQDAVSGIWRFDRTEGLRGLPGKSRSEVASRAVAAKQRRQARSCAPKWLPAHPLSLRLSPRLHVRRRKIAQKTRIEPRHLEAAAGPFSFFFLSYEMLLTQDKFRITKSQMQKLSIQKRATILRCLIEGNSVRSTSRITGLRRTPSWTFSKRRGKRAPRFRTRRCGICHARCCNLTRFGPLSAAGRKPNPRRLIRIPVTCGVGPAFAQRRN